jgi:hypothetical protein
MSTKASELKPRVFGRGLVEPGTYTLDLSSVSDGPLEVNGDMTTFRAVYEKLQQSKIEKLGGGLEVEITTSDGIVVVQGPYEVLSIVRILARLMQQSIDPYRAQWFYYDRDHSIDADELQIFFVVHDGKIVDEHCAFDSKVPLVLQLVERDGEKDIWASHSSFADAWTLYCYRKFYTETVTGQLMVLRPDEPLLYFYTRTIDPSAEIEKSNKNRQPKARDKSKTGFVVKGIAAVACGAVVGLYIQRMLLCSYGTGLSLTLCVLAHCRSGRLLEFFG